MTGKRAPSNIEDGAANNAIPVAAPIAAPKPGADTRSVPDSPKDRHHRQQLLAVIGPAGQSRLAGSRVLVVGCGALGTLAAEYLARAGVGTLTLIDRDIVEWSNLGRQIGFTEQDAREGRPKALALAAHLARINSDIEIDAHSAELRHTNAEEIARGNSVILDATDNVPTRFLINDVSCHHGVPWIYAGAVETGGHVMALPGTKGPCLRCYLGAPPPAGTLATCDTAGVLGPAVAAVAGLEAAIALRILVEGTPAIDELAGRLQQLEVWSPRWRESRLAADPCCPTCVGRRFEYLSGEIGDDRTELCGRKAVQVRPSQAPSAPVDLDSAATRLEPLGRVDRHPHYLRFHGDGFAMTLFADSRAIFDGLTDPTRARSLYSRLVGE